jgi:hypothetical protein
MRGVAVVLQRDTHRRPRNVEYIQQLPIDRENLVLRLQDRESRLTVQETCKNVS